MKNGRSVLAHCDFSLKTVALSNSSVRLIRRNPQRILLLYTEAWPISFPDLQNPDLKSAYMFFNSNKTLRCFSRQWLIHQCNVDFLPVEKTILNINWLPKQSGRARNFFLIFFKKRSDQVQINFKKIILDQDRAKFDLRS
jgi:hypothetical protein